MIVQTGAMQHYKSQDKEAELLLNYELIRSLIIIISIEVMRNKRVALIEETQFI